MRNFVQPGGMISLIAVAAVLSGAGVVKGSIFGIAATNAAIGEEFEAATDGVYALPKKAAVVVTQGQPAYFNAADGTVTNVSAAGLFLIGSFTQAQAGADATGNVRLSGAPVFAAL